MKTTALDAFKHQQAKARAIQDRLLEFLAEGEAAGVAIDPALTAKLQQSISGPDKLKVVLIGGFSEGKTSIAAAWLGRLGSDMKISHQESSDAVAVYEVDADLTLVDTPGLFGYKEKFNADINEQEKYKDITRKHVSEAHLVLYVMNSTNPVKESHAVELSWLFRELDLLPRTVFVLSRFDDVADVADEEDYQQNLAVKRENVVSRLKDLIGLSEDEARHLSLVAVAANPFDAGVEHWLTDPARYRQLSRIPLLQQETARRIEASGGLDRIAYETSKSIILDVLSREMPVAIEQNAALADELRRLDTAEARARADIEKANKAIQRARIILREFVIEHFTDLILQVRGSSMETISEFFEREIGNGGIVLDTKIRNAFSESIDGIASDLVRVQTRLNSEVSAFDSHMLAMGRQGLDWIVKSNVINAGNIKAARDAVWSSFKFKPWGAVKLAKNLNGVVAVAGLAFEAWDTYKASERLKKFEEDKKSLLEDLEGQRAELLGKIDDSDFAARFFPGFAELEATVAEISQALAATRQQHQLFEEWKNKAEAIEAEFRTLVG